MTYCVGLKLNKGIVFMSDTRTNAGVDNISMFRKMFHWEAPGERSVTILTAGNLGTTQAVISLLNERALPVEERGAPSILEAGSMYQVAKLVGDTLREVIREQAEPDGQEAEAQFSATMIVGGQVKGGEARLFLIYPEGNFVEAGDETPFFQIGETKYGKPIIVRAFDPDMGFEDAVKVTMLSFDSTLKANLSVGLPLDLHIYQADSLKDGLKRRIAPNDTYFDALSTRWGDALRDAVQSMPAYPLT